MGEVGTPVRKPRVQKPWVRKHWIRRPAGLRILLGSVLLGVLCVAPLLLYIAFGPADGNPIGLGLLAVLGAPAGTIGAGIGLIVMLVEAVGAGRK